MGERVVIRPARVRGGLERLGIEWTEPLAWGAWMQRTTKTHGPRVHPALAAMADDFRFDAKALAEHDKVKPRDRGEAEAELGRLLVGHFGPKYLRGFVAAYDFNAKAGHVIFPGPDLGKYDGAAVRQSFNRVKAGNHWVKAVPLEGD